MFRERRIWSEDVEKLNEDVDSGEGEAGGDLSTVEEEAASHRATEESEKPAGKLHLSAPEVFIIEETS